MAEKRVVAKVMKVVGYLSKRLEEEGVEVLRIVVFGSHAAGTAVKDSDIDLIIVSKDFRGKDIMKRARAIKNAYWDTMKKFDIPIDVVMESPEEFNPDFGVVVYAA